MIGEPQKMISFDVGIKNMAYCVFEINNSGCNIVDWNVVNLMDDGEKKTDIPRCQEIAKQSKKICGHLAKYKKGELCFCEKHAKTSTFLMPTKASSPTHLKKLKLADLFNHATEHKIPGINLSEKKSQVLEKILIHYDSVLLKPIVTVKKNAKEHSLIEIGKSMKREFQKIPSMKGVHTVLIENQISPLASRMASIQGLLTQYFIMENDENQPDIHIEFISSKNKLKLFSGSSADTVPTVAHKVYKQHKKDGVTYAKQIISNYPGFLPWLSKLDTQKKDDLADCFLQGIWYMNDKNWIQTQ